MNKAQHEKKRKDLKKLERRKKNDEVIMSRNRMKNILRKIT